MRGAADVRPPAQVVCYESVGGGASAVVLHTNCFLPRGVGASTLTIGFRTGGRGGKSTIRVLQG